RRRSRCTRPRAVLPAEHHLPQQPFFTSPSGTTKLAFSVKDSPGPVFRNDPDGVAIRVRRRTLCGDACNGDGCADHLTMRRSRLVGLLVTATGVVGVLGASSASAVTAPRTVALHLTVNGSGTLRIPGHPAFVCHAHFPTSAHCRRNFYVRNARRIVVRDSPASGWKLWRWDGACHGSAASCSLRVKARRFGFVTASFLSPGY